MKMFPVFNFKTFIIFILCSLVIFLNQHYCTNLGMCSFPALNMRRGKFYVTVVNQPKGLFLSHSFSFCSALCDFKIKAVYITSNKHYKFFIIILEIIHSPWLMELLNKKAFLKLLNRSTIHLSSTSANPVPFYLSVYV